MPRGQTTKRGASPGSQCKLPALKKISTRSKSGSLGNKDGGKVNKVNKTISEKTNEVGSCKKKEIVRKKRQDH